MNYNLLSVLRNYRLLNNLKIESFLDELNNKNKLNLKVNTIQKYETGQLKPSNLEIVEAYSKFFGISPVCFFESKNQFGYQFKPLKVKDIKIENNNVVKINTYFGNDILTSYRGIYSNLVQAEIENKFCNVFVCKEQLTYLINKHKNKKYVSKTGCIPGGMFGLEDIMEDGLKGVFIKNNKLSLEESDILFGVIIDSDKIAKFENSKYITYLK